MAHKEQLAFVEAVSKLFSSEAMSSMTVVEVGSYDVNGSVRSFFPVKEYVGFDLTEGPGVDKVYDGKNLNWPEKTADLVISCECFEHDQNWRASFQSMFQALKMGGVFVFTCASRGRAEHGTRRTNPTVSPGTFAVGIDYYKNLTEGDFRAAFHFEDLFSGHYFFYNRNSRDLYFCGVKSGGPPTICISSAKTASIDAVRKVNEQAPRTSPTNNPLKIMERAFREGLSHVSDPSLQNYIVFKKNFKSKLRAMVRVSRIKT